MHGKIRNGKDAPKVISSPYGSIKTIWVQVFCWLNFKDPTRLGYQNLPKIATGGLRCIGNFTMNKSEIILKKCQV
jgi:hypothetical protein